MSETKLWIWGRHPVLEALRADSARTVLIATERKRAPVLDEIRRLAAERGVLVREVPPAEIERIAPGQNTQGVVAQVVEQRLENIGELLARITKLGVTPFLLVLDQIQDPQNLGSLLRTAVGAGVQGVVLPERHSAPITGTVAKVSAGAVAHIPIVSVVNLARALEEVRDAGIWVAGLEGEAKQSIFDTDLAIPLALVVGSEGSGLRRLTREQCDFLVRLPLLGPIESLNAAVAGSIAMYEAVRQRLESKEAQSGRESPSG